MSKQMFIRPISLLIIIIASIFASSTFAALFLSAASPLSVDMRFSLLAAGLNVIILFPVVYYLVYGPMSAYIREIELSKEALDMSEEKYRSLVESTDDSIYLVNKNCEYLFMNAKHRSRMGFVREEYLGRAFSAFHSPVATKIFTRDVDKVFKSGESLQHEHRSERDDRYFLRTLSPVKGVNREVVAVSVVSKNVTKLK
ncbi:MAG TPA: PAS domain-containing protein [Thermodesulfovibrionales bacterium]|nr:PAS domain-containing protein [Thermodesulfovibrionales bacterium]